MDSILLAIALACHISVGDAIPPSFVARMQRDCQKKLAECIYQQEAKDQKRTLTAHIICFKNQ